MKLRRATTLVSYWKGEDFVLENYLTKVSVTLAPVAAEVLSLFGQLTDVEDAVAALPGWDAGSVRSAISSLRAATLLVDGADDADVRLEHAWRHWPQDARFFHFSTKDAPYIEARGDELAYVEEVVSGPQPAVFKRYPDAPRIFLPRDFVPLDGSYREALFERRTHRLFAEQPTGLREFSSLLFYAFSPIHFIDAGGFGTLLMKTSAAAGARHEIEAYLCVFNVDQIEPGIYHYNGAEHSLEYLGTAESAHVRWLTYEQEFCGSAGFTCFLSAVVDRMMAKYRHPRAYRAMLLDAGHLGQVFTMTATALGLGAFQTAALRDGDVEQMIGLDGFAETVLYCVGAGVPLLDESGRPPDQAWHATLASGRKTRWQ